MTSTAPSPAEFLATSDPHDEDVDDLTPLERLTLLEQRVTTLEGGVVLPSDTDLGNIFGVDLGNREQDAVQTMHEELTDLEAKYDAVLQLIGQIGGIVKKSTSKVSLEVKAAIDVWANPLGNKTPSPAPGDPAPEPSAESVPAAVSEASAGEGPPWAKNHPAHDAPVDEWRAYAEERLRGLGYEGDLQQMNRSQIRTLLGIEQLAGA